MKKLLAIVMTLMLLLPIASLSFAQGELPEETTAAEVTTDAEETTAEESTSPLDGILDKIENTDLGIDGFAATEMFGKIIAWLQKLVENIRAFVDNLQFSGALDQIFGQLKS